MARFFRYSYSPCWLRFSKTFLALAWLTGLALGALVFCHAGDSFDSMMRAAALSRVSIVSLLGVLILPFLFSAFAVLIRRPWLMLAAACCKACLFMLLSLAAVSAFGSAGWLVRLLLLFSELISLPLLYWFWHHHISGEASLGGAAATLTGALVFLIGSFDYCCISPLLAGLIEL